MTNTKEWLKNNPTVPFNFVVMYGVRFVQLRQLQLAHAS